MPLPPIVSLRENISRTGTSFLLCGIINTIFGYFGSVELYALLEKWLDTSVIIVLTRILTITFSFFTYKLFAFRVKGNWVKEYFRCYVTYGSTSLIIMTGLYVLVEVLSVPFWLAQLVMTLLGVVLNFVGHSCFTFASAVDSTQKEEL